MTAHPSNPDDRIGVLIIEDQTAIRQMLAAFVAAMPRFKVVGHAGTVTEGLRLADEHRPRIVVLDWMLSGGVGLEFLRAVRVEPPPHIIVFSANTTELAVREALGAGARGYLEKTASFTEFTTALDTVAGGKTYLGPAVTRIVQRFVSQPDRGIQTDLTHRELDVLRHMAEGHSSKEIADLLNLSVRTVENHRASISRRTGLRSVALLTLHAVRLGLVEPVSPAVEVAS